ncbi:MAG: phosphatase PAP2 family protein [Massilia sp.]
MRSPAMHAPAFDPLALYSPWAWLPHLLALVVGGALIATDGNVAVFLALNHAGHILGDALWANLTMFGDGAVALALVLTWIKRAPRCFWAALIAAVFATLWVQLIKQVIDVPRPLAVLAPAGFFQSGPAYRAVSFPSGHAAAIFALAGIWVMSLRGQWLLRASLLVLAVLVSLSRVMVGVHWPFDIVAGMLGGWLSAWIGLWTAARMQCRTSGPGGLLAGLLLLMVSGALLLSHHVGHPDALPLQRLLAAVCVVLGMVELTLLFAPPGLRRAPKGE